MSDIFLSYAKGDLPKAQALARALEKRGWSVWWDRKIATGENFDKVIQQALSDAGCVVVLWSKESVTRRWVLAEAEEGAEREILAPVLIEKGVEPPLAFRRIQSAKLVEWDGSKASTDFQKLAGDIAEILDSNRKDGGDEADEGHEEERDLLFTLSRDNEQLTVVCPDDSSRTVPPPWKAEASLRSALRQSD